jgi:hypothetical protein
VEANHLSNDRHRASHSQAKLATEKRRKPRFCRTILPFATETRLTHLRTATPGQGAGKSEPGAHGLKEFIDADVDVICTRPRSHRNMKRSRTRLRHGLQQSPVRRNAQDSRARQTANGRQRGRHRLLVGRELGDVRRWRRRRARFPPDRSTRAIIAP